MKLSKGVPHLNHDRHSRYFNIVAIEFHIDQLKKIRFSSGTVFKHINKFEDKLEHITKGLSPEELFLEMVEL
ncbi:hypothetical protein [Flavicella sediminum]|uniref:hypothetical protein n=1 Tax=Flavicella sediminum TaxID=2585141 RepID=UPI0011205827|nr:hypothetical protein [Flavicella sediminum]